MSTAWMASTLVCNPGLAPLPTEKHSWAWPCPALLSAAPHPAERPAPPFPAPSAQRPAPGSPQLAQLQVGGHIVREKGVLVDGVLLSKGPAGVVVAVVVVAVGEQVNMGAGDS